MGFLTARQGRVIAEAIVPVGDTLCEVPAQSVPSSLANRAECPFSCGLALRVTTRSVPLTLPMTEANGCCPAIPNSCLTSQEGMSVSVGDGPHHSEYTMVDSFVFQIDWRIVASVIGLIAARAKEPRLANPSARSQGGRLC